MSHCRRGILRVSVSEGSMEMAESQILCFFKSGKKTKNAIRNDLIVVLRIAFFKRFFEKGIERA